MIRKSGPLEDRPLLSTEAQKGLTEHLPFLPPKAPSRQSSSPAVVAEEVETGLVSTGKSLNGNKRLGNQEVSLWQVSTSALLGQMFCSVGAYL